MVMFPKVSLALLRRRRNEFLRSGSWESAALLAPAAVLACENSVDAELAADVALPCDMVLGDRPKLVNERPLNGL